MTTDEAQQLIQEAEQAVAKNADLAPHLAALKKSRGAVVKQEQALKEKKERAFYIWALIVGATALLLVTYLSWFLPEWLLVFALLAGLVVMGTAGRVRAYQAKQVEQRHRSLLSDIQSAKSLMVRDGVKLKEALGHYPKAPAKKAWFSLKK